ncbi:hypothetical protein BRADI_1g39242v3 [Brachypodium distachyon]|uniref:Uncharacterized protein n=1 Tax=Brachypodium distachyon TaxID=15368 RepID=A0A2K2DNK4_BRADI|nr:hypothetical protein BRADI_1g39242v3 [Brachypodium distachyon]
MMYSCKMHWRHMLESDFSVSVLAAADVTSALSIREQFIGQSIQYNMSSTRMFAVPSFVNEY